VILAVVVAVAVIGVRKLGYLKYIHRERLVGWFATVSDELGLRRNRRSFLECQVSISQCTNLADLRHAVASAAQFLALDHCELSVGDITSGASDGCDIRRPGVRENDASKWDPGRTLHISLRSCIRE